MYKLLEKIGKVLFHRMGVILVLIAFQLATYVFLLTYLQGSKYYAVFNVVMSVLSVAVVLWIVSDRSNPGYKIG